MDHDIDSSNEAAEPEYDLTTCDREPIHILGRVQPFGFLLALSSDWIIQHASENIQTVLGADMDEIIGSPAADFLAESTVEALRANLRGIATRDAVERSFGVPLVEGGALFDLSMHLSGRSIVVEAEPHDVSRRGQYLSTVRSMIERVSRAATVQDACDQAARQMRALIGFDRVMIYEFAPDGSGIVRAESAAPGQEPFLGLRYPASDIPKQARALYKRSLLRIISDTQDVGVPVVPATNPEGVPLDLSMSATRAVSPIHLEYLRNMGVGASMSVSVLSRGELWGLIACHHDQPIVLSYELRTAVELFGQMFAYVLEQKLADHRHDEQARARSIHDRLMAQFAEGVALTEQFEDIASLIAQSIRYDGIVGWVDGHFLSQGHTPTREQFMGLVRVLNTTAASTVYHTNAISKVYPKGEDFAQVASGMLCLPVSRTPRDYIVLFRRELARSVTWGGNPNKPVSVGPNGIRLTPRKSFEAWTEVVRGTSDAWTATEISAAEQLRITMMEVVLRMTDASMRERARAQEKQELLIAELNHRVRNILNLIRGLVSQSGSGASDVKAFTQTVGGRIHALARAHDQITKDTWAPASLSELIRLEVEAYTDEGEPRVLISGDDALVQPAAFSTLALVVHELTTNSAKYGALSQRNGRIHVSLSEQSDGALVLNWQESGGPPIQSEPDRRGFGSTIIERSVPYELKGTADVRYDVAGLKASFMVPARHIHAFGSKGDTDADQEDAQADLRVAGNVLVVEDNMIIALDAEELFGDICDGEVCLASSVPQALGTMDSQDFAFAFLDVNLGSETSEPVAQALQQRGVPFAFVTGYGETAMILERFEGTPVLRKPYDKAGILDTLAELVKDKPQA